MKSSVKQFAVAGVAGVILSSIWCSGCGNQSRAGIPSEPPAVSGQKPPAAPTALPPGKPALPPRK